MERTTATRLTETGSFSLETKATRCACVRTRVQTRFSAYYPKVRFRNLEHSVWKWPHKSTEASYFYLFWLPISFNLMITIFAPKLMLSKVNAAFRFSDTVCVNYHILLIANKLFAKNSSAVMEFSDLKTCENAMTMSIFPLQNWSQYSVSQRNGGGLAPKRCRIPALGPNRRSRRATTRVFPTRSRTWARQGPTFISYSLNLLSRRKRQLYHATFYDLIPTDIIIPTHRFFIIISLWSHQ